MEETQIYLRLTTIIRNVIVEYSMDATPQLS